MADTIRIACPATRCGTDCECCGGKGYLDVPMRRPPAHPVTPCCGAAWVANMAPEKWRCEKCGKTYDRREVASW